MTASTPGFRVGLVQMRSGRTPAQNVDAATKLIKEAKSGGADYVLTPEMTNILERKREDLFAAIATEEKDRSLPDFRDLARRLGIWVHVGSLAIEVLPQKAVNRSFLIDPKGDIAARYDKIHMFDVDLAGGESYRESGSFRPGELAVAVDLPWGRVLAEGGTEPGVIFADVDPSQVAIVRARIPSLQHGRRFEVVEPIAEPSHLHVVKSS